MSRFLAMLLDSAAHSDRAMTTGEPKTPVRHTWPQVHRSANGIAAALRAGGLAHGDSVGILAGEPAAIAPVAQAVWLLGGSVTMLHQPTARTDLAAWARDTVAVLRMIDAKLVLLGAPFDALAPVLAEHAIPFRTIDSLGADVSATAAQAATTTPDATTTPAATVSLSADTSVEADPTPFSPDATIAAEHDTALLQLTSGSTADPKAVRITHANLYANITAMVQAAQLDPARDVMVSWLPLFHDMGMVGFLTVPMVVGLELVTVTPVDFLSRPRLWAELISSYGGTVTAAPNFAYAVLARQLGRVSDGELDLSSMRFALNGAEPIDPDAVAAFTDAGARFGLRADAVVAAYGMAETALGVSFAPIDTGLQVDHVDAEALESARRALPAMYGPARRLPKLGAPLPGIEARVVGDDGTVLGEREVGVLQLRGESVTPGYLTVDGPVATQDAEGWFDTGDEGYLAEGSIVVCGRRKDMIIMGGRNIYPTDIERAAAEADGVRAGNVVAVRLAADGSHGSGPRHRESFAVAVESRKAGEPGAEQLIRKDVTSRVVSAVGVRPAEVVVLKPGTLPKTPSGKLRRTASADLLRTHP